MENSFKNSGCHKTSFLNDGASNLAILIFSTCFFHFSFILLLSRLIAVAKYSNDAAQQGRTESIHWRLWQPLYGPCVTLEHSLQPAGISCMLVFAEGGKPENPEKNPRSREENQHKLNPLMASGPGIEPGPHWWEASALTTAPSLLPKYGGVR